jgi:hypothetical protein
MPCPCPCPCPCPRPPLRGGGDCTGGRVIRLILVIVVVSSLPVTVAATITATITMGVSVGVVQMRLVDMFPSRGQRIYNIMRMNNLQCKTKRNETKLRHIYIYQQHIMQKVQCILGLCSSALLLLKLLDPLLPPQINGVAPAGILPPRRGILLPAGAEGGAVGWVLGPPLGALLDLRQSMQLPAINDDRMIGRDKTTGGDDTRMQ